MMRRHITTHIIIAATMLMMWACGGNDVAYCDFTSLPERGWAYGDTLSFTPGNMTDSVLTGHITIALRHNNAYPYSNLWLEVTRPGSDSLHVVRDTVNCVLADIYGRWKGQGFGASYQFTDTLPGSVRLLRGQSVTVRHIMRIDTVTDIEHLGIMLVP